MERCDDCGGLIKGRYNGFEAICRCFNPKKRKKEPLFKERERRQAPQLDKEVADIVKGDVGVADV